MSSKSEETKHGRRKRSSDESRSSYSSRSSGITSDDSYISDRESIREKVENVVNKPNMKQNSKKFHNQQQKNVKPLIRGQKEIKRNGRGDENVTAKVLSENKIKISEMRNKNIELADLISRYEVENRDLMRIIRKQEKSLKQFQEQENSMPSLMKRQSAESHALQEQLRNLRKKLKMQEEKLKAAEDELEQKQRLLKKMKSLVDDHQLKERNELKQKLNEVENELKSKSDVIRNLEKHIENLNKNHKHELGLKKAKQHTTAEELDSVRSELERMQSQLQEKEKELAVLNIYAQQRFQTKPPHRLSGSIRSTPMFDKNETYNPRIKVRNDSLNESKIIEMSPNSEIGFDDQPVGRNVKKSISNSSVKKTTAPKNNQVINDDKKRMTRDQEDIDKRIEEMEKKAKVKSKPDKQVKLSHEVMSDKSEYDLTKTKPAHQETKSNQKQKEMLLSKMKEIDETHVATKKSMKQPMFDDLDDLSTFGSYQPSFGDATRVSQGKVKKKPEVLSGIFYNDMDNFNNESSHDKGRSKSPILLNLSNDIGKRSQFQSPNKSSIPIRTKLSNIATLNGIDSDEEMKDLRLK